MSDTAPRAYWNSTLSFTVRRVQRGKRVRLIPRPFRRRTIGTILREQKSYALAVRFERRLPGRVRHECRDASIHVDPRTQSRYRGGTIKVMSHIVFARPDQLHGHIWHRLRDGRGLRDVVHIESPTEAAAKDVLMKRDLFVVETEHVRHGGTRVARYLRSRPQFGAIVGHPYGRVHRLHRGMRKEWRFVRGVERPRRCGERLFGATVKAHWHTVVVAHGIANVLHHGHRRHHARGCACVAHCNGCGERVHRLARLPPRLGDHRQRWWITVAAAGQRHYRAHTGHGATLLPLRVGYRGGRRGAKRAHGHRRVEHIGQRHIDAVRGRAVRLCR